MLTTLKITYQIIKVKSIQIESKHSTRNLTITTRNLTITLNL